MPNHFHTVWKINTDLEKSDFQRNINNGKEKEIYLQLLTEQEVQTDGIISITSMTYAGE